MADNRSSTGVMTLLLGVITPVYNWWQSYLPCNKHVLRKAQQWYQDANIQLAKAGASLLGWWDGPWLKNPKLNEHPVDHETPLGMVVFFSPLLGGVCVFEKLKNPPPQKKSMRIWWTKKRGFSKVSAKKMRCAGRHLDILDIHMDSL